MYDLEYLYAAIDRGLKYDRVPVPLSGEVRASRINVWRCILFDPFDIIKLKVAGIFGRYK
jgi:hypothetical protein